MKYEDDLKLHGTTQPCIIQRNVHGSWVCLPGAKMKEPSPIFTKDDNGNKTSKELFQGIDQRNLRKWFIIPYTMRRKGKQEKRFFVNGGLVLPSDEYYNKESFIFTLRYPAYRLLNITEREEAIILRALVPEDNYNNTVDDENITMS